MTYVYFMLFECIEMFYGLNKEQTTCQCCSRTNMNTIDIIFSRSENNISKRYKVIKAKLGSEGLVFDVDSNFKIEN